MSRYNLALLLSALSIICIMPSVVLADKLHTPPSKWSESRAYHLPMDSKGKARLDKSTSIKRLTETPPRFKESKFFSPNNAYWYAVHEHANKTTCLAKNCPIIIDISNERDYLIRITLKNVYQSHGLLMNWINEKLLYIEPWWGAREGTYFIYDVEQEKIIHSEKVLDGSAIFKKR